ncbi:MAG: hypothetical protein LIO43_05140 [Clostridiales bacterium]|nr:hypothetical protein [Clostridiales bacterium]
MKENNINNAVVECRAYEADNEVSIDNVLISVSDEYDCENVKKLFLILSESFRRLNT